MGKLLIVGIDGADWEYVSQRLSAGHMPNLAALAREGVFGPLESTRPPLSCPAWPTMTTGLNPGNLGLFDLTVPQGYGKRIVSARDVRAPRLWDYVGACGGRCVVFNVPVTYPPRRVNGVLVADFLSPKGAQFAWPAPVGQELAARFGYSTAPEHRKGRQAALMRLRRDAFLHVLQREVWSVAMVVLSVTDWAQHDHWSDRRHIDRLFDEADAVVGELARVTRAGNVVVLSDHGFCGARRILNLNRLLHRMGFLSYGGGAGVAVYAPNRALAAGAGGALRRALGRAADPRVALRLLHACRLERALDLVPDGLWQWLKGNLRVWATPIEWARTRAYLYNALPQTVNVNLAGREPEGVVAAGDYQATLDELTAALLAAADPLDGGRIVSDVWRREEVFAGRHVGNAPDLLLEVTGDRYLLSPADHPEVVWETGRERGRHRATGIYCMRGPAFRPRGEGPRLRIVDMTPTLLAAVGCPPPSGIDGRPVLSVLSAPASDAKEYRLSVPEMEAGEEDMAAVRKNLQKLGYM